MSSIIFSLLVMVLSICQAFNLPHHPHVRAHQVINSTGTHLAGTADKLMASTAYTTSISTILGCPPSVVKCPVEQATHINLITVAVPASTTLYPVTTTSAAKSTGTGVVKIITETVIPIALSTGLSAPGAVKGTSATSASAATTPAAAMAAATVPAAAVTASAASFSTSITVSQGTYTFTMGAGSSTTVITTTIDITSTITLLRTVLAAGQTANSAVNPGARYATPGVDVGNPTTTFTSTSTSYTTITLLAPSAASSIAGGVGSGLGFVGGPGYGTGAKGLGAEGSNLACASPRTTVTVTLPPTTVFVSATINSEAVAIPSSSPSHAPHTASTTASTTSSTTPVPLYPAGNSTTVVPSSSGFVSSATASVRATNGGTMGSIARPGQALFANPAQSNANKGKKLWLRW